MRRCSRRRRRGAMDRLLRASPNPLHQKSRDGKGRWMDVRGRTNRGWWSAVLGVGSESRGAQYDAHAQFERRERRAASTRPSARSTHSRTATNKCHPRSSPRNHSRILRTRRLRLPRRLNRRIIRNGTGRTTSPHETNAVERRRACRRRTGRASRPTSSRSGPA